MKNTIFISLLLLGLLHSCTRAPDFPDEPVITFNSIENDTIRQNVDTAYVTIDFTDGNGDIGFFENEEDIFLIDTRPGQNNAVTKLFMPMTPVLGAENGIQGEIRFPVVTCCIPPPGLAGCQPVGDEFPDFQEDVVVYEMYIKDRSGNESNRITLNPIYLLCD